MYTLPYLNFDGNCAEAFGFYRQVLGGELHAQTHGESPAADRTPPEARDLVMHARLNAGDLVLMGSDAFPGTYERPQGLWVFLHTDDASEAERIFNAFADGGNVVMPMQQTFWAVRFGMAVDRFGTPWMVDCE